MAQSNPAFRIKICGVTRADDILAVANSAADAIGLNFYPRSSRYVPLDQAERLADHCPDHLQRVGVFVNASRDELLKHAARCGLGWLQLHGDEPPELVAELGDYRIIRAFRCGADGLAPVTKFLDALTVEDRQRLTVLLDAAQPGQYGGTGHTLDWHALANEIGQLRDVPWILAGGLTPHNVAAAINCLQPQGVDTASGVEIAPGIKDPAAIESFAAAADEAFKSLS
ncbi:MAG: phosphoribosylanthranilate isomerase [Pseudomonadales bacterium]|nr:phosphoribosylanthranilate isomerase [Planctomycetales bacterium]MCB1625176.1 phosphoribosylanthranilate isomerase [Pseudomonadales bacterium]